MSVKAWTIVLYSAIVPPAKKLTAATMASYANDRGGNIFLSHATIAKRVGVSRCQAQRYVRELIKEGFLSVVANGSGGAPGTVPLYQLHLDRIYEKCDADDRAKLAKYDISYSATGSVEATGSTDETPTDSTDATGSWHATGSTDAEGSHGCTGRVAPMHETGSVGAIQTVINHIATNTAPSLRSGERASRLPPRPADVDEQTWKDWCALRKGKRAAVTETVIAEARREAEKAGLTLERFFAVWCVRGTQGLQADWLRPNERSTTATKHAGFARKNYREGVTEDGSFA